MRSQLFLQLAALLLVALAPPPDAGAEPASPRASFAVRLEPPADAWRRPWHLRLKGADADERWSRLLAETEANESGQAVLRDVEPQEAKLEVRDADGREWLAMLVDVYPERGELFLPIDLVPVEGILRFGDTPIPGLVAFGKADSGPRIGMKCGKDGKFAGYLPDEGYWSAALADQDGQPLGARPQRVEVRRRPGKTAAEVAIRVPPTTLTGRVHTDRDQPVAGATVTVLRLRKPFAGFPGEPELLGEVTLQTGSAGRFWLRGLEEGTLLLRASHERKSSDWERFELRENFPSEDFVLRVEERELVRGVVTAGSQTVAGARVVARAVTANPRSPNGFVDTVSGPNGEIELLVPAEAIYIDLLVAADSYGTELLRFVRQGGQFPPFLLRLDEARGRLRMPFAGENGSLLLCRNGAAFPWSMLRWILRDRRQLNGPVLNGMAAGWWELCPRNAPQNCHGGYLEEGGELPLE